MTWTELNLWFFAARRWQPTLSSASVDLCAVLGIGCRLFRYLVLFGVPERERLEEAYGTDNPVWKAVGPFLGWVSWRFLDSPADSPVIVGGGGSGISDGGCRWCCCCLRNGTSWLRPWHENPSKNTPSGLLRKTDVCYLDLFLLRASFCLFPRSRSRRDGAAAEGGRRHPWRPHPRSSVASWGETGRNFRWTTARTSSSREREQGCRSFPGPWSW